MAKISGLGALVTVADSGSVSRTISNDVTDFTLSTPRGVQDITGVDKSAHERLLLLADVSVSLKGVLNSAANLSHAVFSTVPSSSVARATSIAPTSNNATPILTFNAVYSDYALTRAAAGELTWQVKGDLSDGALPTWALYPVLSVYAGSSSMGYRLEPKVYNLRFEDYPGLELTARSVPVDELLTIMKLAGSMSEKTGEEQIRDLFARFAKRITGWNVEDEHGKPVPHNLAGLLGLDDFGFVMKLVTAWVEALTGVQVPTAPANGTPGLEASIPMTPPGT